jgi:Arc/MetJ-type ribon-helix-helix transcriptional regulator
MMKAIKFQLDQFGRDALDEFVRRGSGSRSAAVRTASLYYLADRESGRAAWLVRRYATASAGSAVTARLDRETWQALQEEAERQNVSADDLTRHAVLYFLADVDSGRVGQRLESALGDADRDE